MYYNFLSLGITAKTWKRDSHGLFDYECQQAIENSWKLSKNLGLLTRNKRGVNLLEDKDVTKFLYLSINFVGYEHLQVK